MKRKLNKTPRECIKCGKDTLNKKNAYAVRICDDCQELMFKDITKKISAILSRPKICYSFEARGQRRHEWLKRHPNAQRWIPLEKAYLPDRLYR